MKKGLVIVFSGEGKGKTSAAIGCTLRMLGWGKQVVYCTFFKKNSGEFKILKSIEGCTLFMFCRGYPVYPSQSEKKKFHARFMNEWSEFLKIFQNVRKCNLIVLDEILIAVRNKILKDRDIISFIDTATEHMPGLHIILTGRGTTKLINKRADIVTKMRCLKHPYPHITAQKGIDY
ncbi:MAG: cob(I)yrinic acid a,c-diamide adenosyltransferase [Candidatus Ratteibacteria bacterium]